ncbi:hypothetical protein LLH03_02860 [bacterium]|nr:hypothetical protein [bacterium]
MSDNDQRPYHRGLNRTQRRLLLWLPLVGLWAVLFLVSKSPESDDRDWPSFVMMAVVGGLVFVGVWLAVMKLTTPKAAPEQTVDEKVAHSGGRAALIYGKEAPKTAEDQKSDAESEQAPESSPPEPPAEP